MQLLKVQKGISGLLYASAIGRDTIDDAQVHTSQKDERVSIFSLISALFGNTSDEELLRLSYDVDDTPETIEQWVEGNIGQITDPAAVAQAYQHLSRADEYLGNTYRRQYHTLWRYATAIMLLGVADAAGGKGIHARIMPPERWQKMSTAKKQKAIRIALLNKIAGAMHIPQSTLREEYLSTISLLVEHNPAGYSREMMLDADQLNFFLNDRVRSSEIVKAIEKEEKEKEKEQQKAKEPPKKESPKKARKEQLPFPEPQPELIPVTELPVKEKPAKEIPPKDVPAKEPEPATVIPPEPAEKKPAPRTQSTLFDGF
jgi:replication factor C large subunit